MKMNGESLSVAQYFKILDILKQDQGDAFETNIDLINCIGDIDAADIPIVKLNYYLSELSFLENPYKPKAPKKQYTINGINFTPLNDINKITTAQYVDFQEFVKREDNKHLLNVYLTKEGEEYGQSDYSDLLWENLSFTDYEDVRFFFVQLLNKLMTDTLNYSKKILKKQYRRTKDPQKRQELMNQMIQIQQTLLTVNDNEFIE